ncbi:MAG TPA: hypothetical protein VGN23_16565 [Verrucomicrobiae bacterium]|jgi:hypothetical protein
MALAFVALTARVGMAQTNDNSTITDFSAFQLIPQRNIFNPSRFPNEQVNYRQQNQAPPEFTLVGTMSYRKGMFAFFNGSDTEYQKSVQEGGTIAGFTVKNISMNSVMLLSTNLSTNMMVGQAMQQEGEGWALNDNGMTYSESSGGSSYRENGRYGRGGMDGGRRRRGNYDGSSSNQQTAPAAEAAPAPSSDLNNNDVLKRLMQQRQQQEK